MPICLSGLSIIGNIWIAGLYFRRRRKNRIKKTGRVNSVEKGLQNIPKKDGATKDKKLKGIISINKVRLIS